MNVPKITLNQEYKKEYLSYYINVANTDNNELVFIEYLLVSVF